MMSPRASTTPALAKPPEPLAPEMKSQWAIDPGVTYLNHGCFGARPRTVLAARKRLLERMERQPIQMLDRERRELIDQTKETLGRLLGMQGANFGFVTNATGAVNAVLRSLRFGPGDAIVSTSHVYNAVRQTMRHLAATTGAEAVEVPVPLPVRSPEEILAAITAALTDRTRLLIVDHIASPTAVVFPVREILSECAARGIDVLVDGAHAPGMLDLSVEDLAPAYYAGNLHKWLCAPMGAAFLWARPDRQEGIHPTTISHFLGEGLAEEFNWQGTRDITPWLCCADSIAYLESLGLERVRQHNHQLAVWAQAMLSEWWGTESATPVDGSMIGSMAAVRLPDAAQQWESAERFQAALLERFAIEAPIIEWDGSWWVRVSCQVYNTPQEYQRLAEAVLELTASAAAQE